MSSQRGGAFFGTPDIYAGRCYHLVMNFYGVWIVRTCHVLL